MLTTAPPAANTCHTDTSMPSELLVGCVVACSPLVDGAMADRVAEGRARPLATAVRVLIVTDTSAAVSGPLLQVDFYLVVPEPGHTVL